MKNTKIVAPAHLSPSSNRHRETPKAVDLKTHLHNPFLRWITTVMEKPIEKALALNQLNKVHEHAALDDQGTNFFQSCLDCMQITYSVSKEDTQKIPKEGPLVIVANHPFGCLEGIVLGNLMNNARTDTKALGNYLLQNIHELREWVIPVDPFDRASSPTYNLKGIKQAVKWVKSGGALITFPAGKVSHFQWKHFKTTDSEWSRHIGAIIRLAKANVLPVYFPGRNSFFFQFMGLLHPAFRTALIPREIINKRFKSIKLYIGKPIPWKKLESYSTYEEIATYLKAKTYFLQNRVHNKKNRTRLISGIKPKMLPQAPTANETPLHLLRDEINALPESQKLVEVEEYTVHIAPAQTIPNIIREIGRLREITFREVKEGTGQSLDLDSFDQHYLHLFLWNKNKEQLAGAYRIGLMDNILKEYGKSGLYTNTLFRFKTKLLKQLQNAIELGRSFIRAEYQKEYNCLSLLWRGIGEFIARNPRYKILFGPVSISNDYHAVSKNLLVQFLRQYKLDADLSRYVRPRKPYRYGKKKAFGKRNFSSVIRNIDDVSLLISEIEKDGRGIPILLRHYLKLNATILSFNVDKNFSNVVDGLIMVDLTKTNVKLLKRFMGKEGLKTFAQNHELVPDPDILRIERIADLPKSSLIANDQPDHIIESNISG